MISSQNLLPGLSALLILGLSHVALAKATRSRRRTR
jgi:hypothetical protein